eukprot:3565637-Rhodomonas_salina.2
MGLHIVPLWKVVQAPSGACREVFCPVLHAVAWTASFACWRRTHWNGMMAPSSYNEEEDLLVSCLNLQRVQTRMRNQDTAGKVTGNVSGRWNEWAA